MTNESAAPRRQARTGLRFQGRPSASPLLLAGIVGIVGLIVLGFYAWLPHATVVLHPRVETVSGALEIRADPSIQAVDLPARRVPARVAYLVVDVSEQVLTQGRLPAPAARAEGAVTFTSRQAGGALIPAGTLVMTPSGVRFATLADARVGEGAEGLVRVRIQAVEPGETGNVARLEINRIVGPLAGRLAVLNEEPTAGGGQSSTPVISEADLARARAHAAERARADGLSRLRAEGSGEDTFVLPTLDFTILDERFDRGLGELATSFTYDLRARLTATSVGREDVRRLAQQHWRPPIPGGHFLPEEQLRVWPPEVVRTEDRALVLRVPVHSVAVPRIDPERVRSVARWRSADEVRRDLVRELPLAGEPRVLIGPPWAGRALRVDVVLDLREPEGSGG